MTADKPLVNYYAQRAQEYDRIYAKPERQADLAALRERVARFAEGRRVLEVACGTGWWTQFFAPVAESVTALDINPEVLEIAAQRVRGPSVRWLCRDLYSAEPIDYKFHPNSEIERSNLTIPPKFSSPTDLPQPQECEGRGFRRDAENNTPEACAPQSQSFGFNAGLAAFWWSHVPRKRLPKFLRTFHRHLDPGANVLFLDNRYVPGSSTAISRVDVDGNTYQLRALDSGSVHEVLKNFPEPAELEQTLAPYGSHIRVELLDYYWCVTYRTLGRGQCQGSGMDRDRKQASEGDGSTRPASASRAPSPHALASGEGRLQEGGGTA